MKNLDRKSNETDSPKTPGGISKSLLTPIRRLGLSRKWKKSGTSPFVSPLAGNIVKNNEDEEREIRSRKRKLCVDEETQNLPLSPITDSSELKNIEINSTPPPPQLNEDTESTPVRRVAVSRKKSKSSILSPVGSENIGICTSTVNFNNSIELNKQKSNEFPEKKHVEDTRPKQKSNSEIKNTNKSPKKLTTEEENKIREIKEKPVKTEENGSYLQSKEMCISEPKVPNLTKECIVVIQNKIYKQTNKKIQSNNKKSNKEDNTMSQVLFDSDSDDVPLSSLNKKDPKQKLEQEKNKGIDDDDFIDTKSDKNKKVILNKASNNSKKANSSKIVIEEINMQKKSQTLKEKKVDSSQKFKNVHDDDDDDFELNKKTILIRKSYDKVIKPSKSKSTGSITQKDIDELRARIEMKKKLLIAKSMTKDTEELRGLIKKWQKGCQDALMELLDLMKKKIPDQSNMDYSYILEMLKIPPSLVGYDEENECFNTPDDDSILTAAFNDL